VLPLPPILVLAINHHLMVCLLYDLYFVICCVFIMFIVLLVYLESRRRVTSEPSLENKILESSVDNKVDFTLKELVMYNIDKRRNEFIEHRITEAEIKCLFLIVGATVSINGSVVGAVKTFSEKNEIKKIAGVRTFSEKK
jgi:hypothetical protein